MSLLKILLVIVVLAVAGGCANQAMDHAVASWQGKPAAAVIAAWGEPSEELRVSGKHLLLWNVFDGKLAQPGQKKPLPGAAGLNCVRLLEVAGNGKIASGTWDGNDCPGWFSGWTR